MTDPQVLRAATTAVAATASPVLEAASLVLGVLPVVRGAAAAVMTAAQMIAVQIAPTDVAARAPVATIGSNRIARS
ncbi:MAG: hypothetical protein HOJ85_07435 [Ilumatobacter sp.]|uniref:hypothetical protein n=1 Tax=Ilumatobacter sp. TaxID=1967498 RepID=UPI0037532858|nr:hypothetical protein [Ilumatobacter sp.]